MSVGQNYLTNHIETTHPYPFKLPFNYGRRKQKVRKILKSGLQPCLDQKSLPVLFSKEIDKANKEMLHRIQ